MTRVYVVTSGDDESCNIHGAFSSPAKAKRVAFVVDGVVRDCRVDPREWEQCPKGMRWYNVKIRRDGEVRACYRPEWRVGEKPRCEFDKRWPRWGWELWVCCWAKDDRHAMKIASEHRRRLIAENKWPAPKPRKPAKPVKGPVRDRAGAIAAIQHVLDSRLDRMVAHRASAARVRLLRRLVQARLPDGRVKVVDEDCFEDLDFCWKPLGWRGTRRGVSYMVPRIRVRGCKRAGDLDRLADRIAEDLIENYRDSRLDRVVEVVRRS